MTQKTIQGPAVIHIQYQPDELNGYMSLNKKNRPFKISCEVPCVGSGVGRTIMIQQLPLKEGYEMVYQVFHPQPQKVRIHHLVVVSKEFLEVEAGRFEVFRIEDKAMNEGGESTLWISCDTPRLLVKSRSKNPLMGAIFNFELQKVTT